MDLWNRLSSRNKPELFVPVQWSIIPNNKGMYIRIFKGDQRVSVALPLQLSISELRKQPDLAVLEAIETLWFEEWLEESADGYTLPYDKFAETPADIRQLLSIPEPEDIKVKLAHEGAVGAGHFRFVLEKHTSAWKNLEKTSRSLGPWLKLPDQTWILMSPEQYRLQQLVEHQPDTRDRDRIFSYIAQVRSEAVKLGIAMDEYLEKQDYKFANGIDIEVTYDGSSIKMEPLYVSGDSIPASVLRQMSQGGFSYASDPEYGKIFVDPDVIKKSGTVRESPLISGQDIPRFVENPEAFLPDIGDLDLSLFGERVKSLGIRVYRSQPFVHASDKGRGWFELEAGIAVMDENGETKSSFTPSEFHSIMNDSIGSGDEYFNMNGEWIKVPHQIESFSEAADRLKQTWGNNPQIDVTRLPYVLEIFENIGQLEFNQPILEVQRLMTDQGVLTRTPPAIFQGSLKPFQEDGYVWMKSLHYRKWGGLLADDMGLGKTIQVISMLSYLHEIGQLTPTLIVLPKTLIDNWQAEIRKFAGSLGDSLYVHSGVMRIKSPEIISMNGITLTTYQTLVRDQLAFGQVEWQAVICDEAQAIKNPTTAASKVLKAMKAKFRLALTGTPVENGLSELWSIMDYVQPGLLGSLSEFKRDFINKLDDEERDPAIEQNLLARISMVYKRRTKSEELAGQLPTKTLIEVPVALGNEQKLLYGEVINRVKSKNMTALQAIQVLRALCSHPALVDEKLADMPIQALPKLEKTIEILREVRIKGEKALIFTDLHRMQDLLRNAVREHLGVNPFIINGMTDRRQSIVDLFNRTPGFDVMILSPKAAGTGLTITSANHVIHYTRWWNPAVENQATDRVYRIGQDKPVQVYFPIVTDFDGALRSGTVEQIVHRILSEKQELASSIIVSSRKLDVESEVMRSLFE